jgi:hypothetical protein
MKKTPESFCSWKTCELICNENLTDHFHQRRLPAVTKNSPTPGRRFSDNRCGERSRREAQGAWEFEEVRLKICI